MPVRAGGEGGGLLPKSGVEHGSIVAGFLGLSGMDFGYHVGMKRGIVSIVLCLVLGAMINVAVAWTFAWFISQPYQDPQTGILDSRNYLMGLDNLEQPSWFVETWWEIGSTQICSEPWPKTEDDFGVAIGKALLALEPTGQFNFPSGVRPNQPVDMADQAGIKPLVEDLRGWPFYSMRCSFSILRLGSPSGGRTNSGIELEFQTDPGYVYGWMGARALPLRPIWSGFILNTLFYGVLAWLAVPGPLALRRLLRARRGLCMKCAYPIGAGEICTEFGAAVTPR